VFDKATLLNRLMILVPLVLSLTVHEWAHAISAFKLGDDTAAREGRLTLNPIVHMDPIGTFLLPLLGIPFGWAKPVPVNPARFRRNVSMGTGMMLTALAGPASNLVLAVLSTIIYALAARFKIEILTTGAFRQLLRIAIQMNVGLALFNMIPIPPLDGSRIVDAFLPYRFRSTWETINQYSTYILLAVFYFSDKILSIPITLIVLLLQRLALAIAQP
jgi:Zn-dependent protease